MSGQLIAHHQPRVRVHAGTRLVRRHHEASLFLCDAPVVVIERIALVARTDGWLDVPALLAPAIAVVEVDLVAAVQASTFHDVSNTHGGYEIYFDYSYGWRQQRWYIDPSIGVCYKCDALNNYYWGVTEEEASLVVAPYEASAGINTHARLMMGYQLSRNWSLSIVAEYERINDEAAASPIVEDRNVFGYFTGFAYRFR